VYVDCADARAKSQPSGVYTLDPGDGGPTFAAYCDMDDAGGGWTLAIKADGALPTFRYDAPLWESDVALAPDAPDLDTTEAKLDSFARTAFTEVRLVMIGSAGERAAVIRIAGASLLEVFAAGSQPLAEPLGTQQWLALVPGGVVDASCPYEGINVGNNYNRVRLGIVTNNDAGEDCDPEDGTLPSWDTKLGIGGSFACAGCDRCRNIPGDMAGPAVGSNTAGCGTVTTFAYVFVR
jgi:hypothetical protein